MGKKLKVVGKSCPRKEAVEIVTGKAKYAADIILPNMLHAKILGSAHPFNSKWWWTGAILKIRRPLVSLKNPT